MASHGSRSLAEAAPSVPRATGTPAASRSGMRANPLASFWLDAGQWATAAPRRRSDRGRRRRGARRGRAPCPARAARCRAGPRSASGRGAGGRGRARRRSRRRGRGRGRRTCGELTDGPQLRLVEQVGAVRADPAPVGGRRVEQVAAHASRSSKRRRSGPANSTNTGPPRGRTRRRRRRRPRPPGRSTCRAPS